MNGTWVIRLECNLAPALLMEHYHTSSFLAFIDRVFYIILMYQPTSEVGWGCDGGGPKY